MIDKILAQVFNYYKQGMSLNITNDTDKVKKIQTKINNILECLCESNLITPKQHYRLFHIYDLGRGSL